MISTRSAGLLIDTVVCLTLAKWETVSGRFGGYLKAPPERGLKVHGLKRLKLKSSASSLRIRNTTCLQLHNLRDCNAQPRMRFQAPPWGVPCAYDCNCSPCEKF